MILPEKLSYGLFFGANARILARLIPSMTPELHSYLDYLRKLGDLMVNYSASSVFLLDHEHRFEMIEGTNPWNFIDPTLSLNILKKREVTSLTVSNTVSRVSSVGNNNSGRQQSVRKSGVICWQFNQQDGCAFTPNCRFVHMCNIVGCGQDHPAYKHVFRATTSTTQQSGSSSTSGQGFQSKTK